MLKKWKESCGVPASAYDVAAGGRSVEVLLYHDAKAPPLQGNAVLISSHIVITNGPWGKVLFWVAFHIIKGIHCTECLFLPGKSFDIPIEESESPLLEDEIIQTSSVGRKVISLDIFADGAVLTLKVMGSEGERFARAAMFLWRLNRGEVEPISIPLYHAGDAIYALSGAPVRLTATLVQRPSVGVVNQYETKRTPVDIVMVNEKEIYIVKKPQNTALLLWRDLKDENCGNVEVLPLNTLALLIFPTNTSLKIVGSRGEVWIFEISDPSTDSSVRSALQRLTELFLLGVLKTIQHPQKSFVPTFGLRYFDMIVLYQQYCAMDTDGVGYVLRSTLEAALGPVLSSDARLVQAVTFHEEQEEKDHHDNNSDDNNSDDNRYSRVSLTSYMDRMRILLQGTLLERAMFAFRAFGGIKHGGDVFSVKGENRNDSVRVSDFKLIARDILLGLRFKPLKENETIDDLLNHILSVIEKDCHEESGVPTMSFEIFLQAYKLLLERVEIKKKGDEHANDTFLCGTPPPLLGFGAAQWVLITHLLAGVEASVCATLVDGNVSADKNTFDVTNGTPTISSMNDSFISQQGMTSVSSGFFLKRIPMLQNDHVSFTDYAPRAFQTIRERFGVDVREFLDALGISALRARLLLGRFCAPRDFRSSGRSGALMLSSHNYRFVLKSVSPGESRTLRRFLPAYITHLERHPHTLLPRYAGLYALWYRGSKSAFVVMENIFAPAQFPIEVVYDLKGSTLHRSTSIEHRKHGAAAKDKDFLADNRRLYLSANARDALMFQLESDTQFLEESNTLDYSLLVGIYIIDSETASSKESAELLKQQERRMSELTKVPSDERKKMSMDEAKNYVDSVFHGFYGGVGSSDGSRVYYFGIVDCLTTYGLKKVGEHYGKSMLLQDMKEVSCVPPPDYRSRFLNFVRSIIDE
ncbi:phosphatidylinositol-4-phosphate 5-kinase type II beta [Trypanosoma theileri]|uniref:Phosphatidylinositol-4-phosphate 5-kinase type II beta n=1 Tax=Trypanosoma theileri TaxID=67003 RepID=A0A1X0NL98_9TRYP|nr:phosphatidylinositol-4-phosphate 5-kinase type II beta [Trypanosoma theileri]ORC85223.1 phosphatidylinositol-4-phosphate 5-kinase type II beta [Trypanosoma theileri]